MNSACDNSVTHGCDHQQQPPLLTHAVLPHSQVLNLFLALLLSSFSSDNLSAPDEDGDLNNIQIAVARINAGVSWLASGVCELCSGGERRRRQQQQQQTQQQQQKKMSLAPPETGMALLLVANHAAEANGGVFGRYGERYAVPEGDSYMTNPNLTLVVPIAPGESDVEFLEEEEESESSEDEDNKPVRRFLNG